MQEANAIEGCWQRLPRCSRTGATIGHRVEIGKRSLFRQGHTASGTTKLSWAWLPLPATSADTGERKYHHGQSAQPRSQARTVASEVWASHASSFRTRSWQRSYAGLRGGCGWRPPRWTPCGITLRLAPRHDCFPVGVFCPGSTVRSRTLRELNLYGSRTQDAQGDAGFRWGVVSAFRWGLSLLGSADRPVHLRCWRRVPRQSSQRVYTDHRTSTVVRLTSRLPRLGATTTSAPLTGRVE